MWGSIVVARRASLIRDKRALNLLLIGDAIVNLPQVPHCRTLISEQTLHFSTWVSPKFLFPQNPRFFSNDSVDPIGDCDDEKLPLSGSSDFDSVDDESKESVSFEFGDETPSDSLDSTEAIDSTGNDESIVQELDLEKLESVLSLLQSSINGDGSLESSLEKLDLTLNEEFVVRIVETKLVPGEKLIKFFNWVLKKPDFSVTTRALDGLVRAVCSELKKKNAFALWDLVKEIGLNNNGVLTTEILNELISLLSRLGKAKASFDVFNMFGEFGAVPNSDTYYYTIEALCRRSFYDWACSVCEKMNSEKKLPENEKIGKIIGFLCKGSKLKNAHSVYLLAKEKERDPTRSSINFLISSLCRNDETIPMALNMLEDFLGERRKFAIKPFSSVIQALCRIKELDGTKKLLLEMIEAGPPPGKAVFNYIITGFSKDGNMIEAIKTMRLMEERGLKPDLYTYNVIMSGFVKGGEMDEACKVLDEAKKQHSKLCPSSYHTLIRGYVKLEQFDKALDLFRETEKFGVEPNVDEYNKLIQSLCLKAADWEMAEKLSDEMKEKGMYLNGMTKGLVRAVKELEKEGEEIEEASVEE